MKKLIINIVLIITALLIYYLQSNFFNWFNISGVMPNIYVILVLFIGLFSSQLMGMGYGIAIGVVLDLLLGRKIGIYAVSLGLIGFLAGVFDKNFSKDSRMTIMCMSFGVTVIYEILSYILKYIFDFNQIEIFSFIKILIVEIIFNLIITVIVYPLFQKAGYYIENEYKGNKILTRYF
ncbi:MAG: rod shape-determining protein MreD [Clostridia bacterium]|nr:rod shape-determining protein MreD [Clostridia bacterium]